MCPTVSSCSVITPWIISRTPGPKYPSRVPAVTIGRGGIGGNGHALDEFWVNRDGHLAIQRGLLLTLATTGIAGITP